EDGIPDRNVTGVQTCALPISLLVIGLFIATMINGSWRLSIIGVAGFLVAALIAGSIYPFLIQEYRVSPTEQTMEAPYIERNIQRSEERRVGKAGSCGYVQSSE